MQSTIRPEDGGSCIHVIEMIPLPSMVIRARWPCRISRSRSMAYYIVLPQSGQYPSTNVRFLQRKSGYLNKLIGLWFPPDSGIIINITANRIPSTRTELSVETDRFLSALPGLLHLLFSSVQVDLGQHWSEKQYHRQSETGRTAKLLLLKNFIMISKFINAQANKNNRKQWTNDDRIIFYSSVCFSGGTELLCWVVSVSCIFFCIPSRLVMDVNYADGNIISIILSVVMAFFAI